MSYVYGAPCKARNSNVVYMYTYRIFRTIARTLRIKRTPKFSAFLLKYR
jgi:hypothetical protein